MASSLSGIGKALSQGAKEVAKDAAKQTATNVATDMATQALTSKASTPSQEDPASAPTKQDAATAGATAKQEAPTSASAAVKQEAPAAAEGPKMQGPSIASSAVEAVGKTAINKVAAKAVPGLGTAATIADTADAGVKGVKGVATAMDSTKSEAQRTEGTKQAISGGVKIGATAAGAAIGSAFGGVGAGPGAQIGSAVGDVADTAMKVTGLDGMAAQIAQPVMQMGGQLNDQVKGATGIDVAGSTQQVATLAEGVTGTASKLTDPGGMVMDTVMNKNDGSMDPNAMMGKLQGMMGQKGAEVDPQALTKSSNSITPLAAHAAQETASVKEQAAPKVSQDQTTKAKGPQDKEDAPKEDSTKLR